MDLISNIDNGKLYRGGVPFFLKTEKEQIIYISSSNKNIRDYFLTLKENINVLKIENYNYEENELSYIMFNLLEKLNIINSKILISIEAIFNRYFIDCEILKFEKKRKYNLRTIIEKLEQNGFKKNYLVENTGEYSLRGDILDVFSLDKKYPIRLEFFDDYLEDIRLFDVETQKSIEKKDIINVYMNKNKEKKTSFFDILDMFPNKNRKFYMENIDILNYKVEEYILNNREKEEFVRKEFSKLKIISSKIELQRFTNKELESYQDYNYLKKIAKKQDITILTEEKKRYREIFQDKPITILKNPHYEGFKYKEKLFLTDRELKGVKVKRVEKNIKKIKYKKIDQILVNDYIIHEIYGVGIYLGLEEISGFDYLKIKYADEDKLFVPINSLTKIERYVSEPGIIPDIFRLGRGGFRKRKEKLQKNIEKFAKEIIEIQAKRSIEKGYSFSFDTVWQEEFEEGFPYNETKDQLKTILEVKKDMESNHVMDRVVCGDVGYGKTEIAMRAAFKSVMDGKQVVILAPTTVLVNQHLKRFTERFQNFPVEFGMLSRLKTIKEQKDIIKKLEKGIIDIILGTHRLLSKDIKFQNLGLVIIDEEQKFGVKAKEYLKKIREGVDMLTLTATPIPRTLNLALLGIRAISIIQTPPSNRIPIETHIIKKNKIDIKHAIIREVSREGQVFYLYNSVKKIIEKQKELKKLLPKYIVVDHIHGQMPSLVIKDKINRFENGDIDILITTTIIENGIDIENANTIIIENFDKLGLAQVYQLRGRVGRSGKKAYCYLIVESLTKGTKKGLKKRSVMNELKELGAGFQLSLEDMKIRGAGEILGEKQHGALKLFGYDMYLKMLEKEIKIIKGNQNIKESLELDIVKTGYIPSDYIKEEEKVVIYRRLLNIDEISELIKIKVEINDRFGKLPIAVEGLFEYLTLKIMGQNSYIKSIKQEKDIFKIKFIKNKINMEKLYKLILSKKINFNQKDQEIIATNIMDFLKMYNH